VRRESEGGGGMGVRNEGRRDGGETGRGKLEEGVVEVGEEGSEGSKGIGGGGVDTKEENGGEKVGGASGGMGQMVGGGE